MISWRFNLFSSVYKLGSRLLRKVTCSIDVIVKPVIGTGLPVMGLEDKRFQIRSWPKKFKDDDRCGEKYRYILFGPYMN